MYNSLHLFGETIAPLAALVTLLFVAFVALFPALAGYLALRLAPAGMAERGGRSLLLLFPGVWGLVEWLRGRALGGFPWLDLGASQTDSLLSGYGPVLGEYGMGAAVTLSAGAALWWVMGAARARWLFAPYWHDAHPDHVAASRLVEAARFWAKLTKTDMPHEPHYPQRILYYWVFRVLGGSDG